MKKTFALICTLAMLLTSIPVGAFELETVESTTETAVETTVAETAAETNLEAVTADVPGLNILTGTKELLTFDGENDLSLFTGAADQSKAFTLSVVEDPEALKEGIEIDPEGTYGKMLQMSVAAGANPWASLKIPNVNIAGGRNYWIHTENFTSSEVLGNVWCAYLNVFGTNKHQSYNIAKNEWASTSQTLNLSALSTFEYRFRASQATANVDGTAAEYPVDYYYDNLALVPYYKINYIGADETTTVQVLFEDGKSGLDHILTEYTVKDDNYAAPFVDTDGNVCTQIGWATTDGATVTETTVALANADVNLYPVYEKQAFLTLDIDSLTAATSTSGTITADRDVTWSWTFGERGGATLTAEGRTVTIKPNGGTCTVYVTATATDDSGLSATATVHILGGGNWFPGLNIFTFTKDPVSFENDSTAGLTLALNAGSKIVDNPNKTAKNASKKVLKLGNAAEADAEGYYSFSTRNWDMAIEAGRPILLTYDWYGTNNITWVMSHQAPGNQVIKKVTDGNFIKSDWQTIKLNQSMSTDIKSIYIQIGNRANREGYFDNYSIIPYYKVTYKAWDAETSAWTNGYTEYVLLDAQGNFLTEYTPDLTKAADGVVGFALTEGGEKIKGNVKLEYKDITLYPLTTAPTTFTDGETNIDVPLTENEAFTVPTPASLGFELENFIAWVDGRGELIYAGEEIAWADIAKVNGMTLTAWCQNLTLPAVGFDSEKASFSKGGFKYAEDITDDGRTVKHLHQYLGSWNSGGSYYQQDVRTNFTVRTGDNPGFDATEYNVLQYAYKAANLSNAARVDKADESKGITFTDKDSTNRSIYYYTLNSDDGYYKNGANRIPTNDTVYGDGNYHVVEWDMTNSANFGHTAWTGGTDSKIFGFAIDPAHVSGQSDVYIDYLRVYRDGYFTVTYDSNFSADDYGDGATVSYNVPADTGRGGGTNYLLKGDKPVLTGEDADSYVFLGWALTKEDADEGKVVDAIPNLTANTTVYAAWGDFDVTPDVEAEDIGIRSDREYTRGVRFASAISNESRALASEYGFIIAREDVLGSNELTFDFKDEKTGAAKYAYGAAYDKAKGIEKTYSTTADGIIFSAVAVNVPQAHYATKLVARTYMKYAVGEKGAVTLYGAAATTSLKETAQAIKDANGTEYEDNKAYVDEILAATAE